MNIFENWKKVISEKAEEVSKKTGEVVEVVANKTEQTIEVQKIKNQIHVMRRSNDRDLKDIGKMIYLKYKKGEEVDEQYRELCETIAERDNCIEKSKADIAKIKGEDVCPKCEAVLATGAKYCQKCGTEIR